MDASDKPTDDKMITVDPTEVGCRDKQLVWVRYQGQFFPGCVVRSAAQSEFGSGSERSARLLVRFMDNAHRLRVVTKTEDVRPFYACLPQCRLLNRLDAFQQMVRSAIEHGQLHNCEQMEEDLRKERIERSRKRKMSHEAGGGGAVAVPAAVDATGASPKRRRLAAARRAVGRASRAAARVDNASGAQAKPAKAKARHVWIGGSEQSIALFTKATLAVDRWIVADTNVEIGRFHVGGKTIKTASDVAQLNKQMARSLTAVAVCLPDFETFCSVVPGALAANAAYRSDKCKRKEDKGKAPLGSAIIPDNPVLLDMTPMSLPQAKQCRQLARSRSFSYVRVSHVRSRPAAVCVAGGESAVRRCGQLLTALFGRWSRATDDIGALRELAALRRRMHSALKDGQVEATGAGTNDTIVQCASSNNRENVYEWTFANASTNSEEARGASVPPIVGRLPPPVPLAPLRRRVARSAAATETRQALGTAARAQPVAARAQPTAAAAPAPSAAKPTVPGGASAPPAASTSSRGGGSGMGMGMAKRSSLRQGTKRSYHDMDDD